MENKSFSIMQVSEMTGVSQNRIREWQQKGFLPGIRLISVGSRHHRRFSEEAIAKIDRLMQEGWTLKSAAQKATEG